MLVASHMAMTIVRGYTCSHMYATQLKLTIKLPDPVHSSCFIAYDHFAPYRNGSLLGMVQSKS